MFTCKKCTLVVNETYIWVYVYACSCACVCMGVMPTTAQGGWRTFRCPLLLLSALLHWGEVSHWTQTSPLFRWDCCAASPSEPSVLAPHSASCRCWGPCLAFYVGARVLNSHLHKNSYPLSRIPTPNETKYEFSFCFRFWEMILYTQAGLELVQ